MRFMTLDWQLWQFYGSNANDFSLNCRRRHKKKCIAAAATMR
jgi:hypothetical protein